MNDAEIIVEDDLPVVRLIRALRVSAGSDGGE